MGSDHKPLARPHRITHNQIASLQRLLHDFDNCSMNGALNLVSDWAGDPTLFTDAWDSVGAFLDELAEKTGNLEDLNGSS
jgi:hypothetical protein